MFELQILLNIFYHWKVMMRISLIESINITTLMKSYHFRRFFFPNLLYSIDDSSFSIYTCTTYLKVETGR